MESASTWKLRKNRFLAHRLLIILVNVQNSLRLYSGWLGATWDLISTFPSLHLQPILNLPLSLPFPFSRKQVLLGWVGASCRGGASREAGKGSVQRGGDTSAAQGDLTHQARDGYCSWWGCSHMFLQQPVTVISPYQKKSHTSLSLHPVLNIYKKLRVKATMVLYILKKNILLKNPRQFTSVNRQY